MQGNNSQQGGQKQQGGLSWTQSAPSHAGGTPNQSGQKPATPAATQPVKSAPMPSNKNTNNQAKPAQGGNGRMVGIFVSGVIVGLIIGWGWFSLRTDKVASTVEEGTVATEESGTTGASTGSTKPAVTTPAAAGTVATETVSSGSLAVSSNQAAGLSVAVSGISVSVPTWIVVMDNLSGKAGNALGAAMFFPGQKSGTIELLRATVAGKSYLVGEYADNGDHLFSKQKDTQVMGIAGNPMLVEFTAK